MKGVVCGVIQIALRKATMHMFVSCAKLVFCNVHKLVTIILNTDMDVLLFVASLLCSLHT